MDEINFLPTIWIGPTALQRELVCGDVAGVDEINFIPTK